MKKALFSVIALSVVLAQVAQADVYSQIQVGDRLVSTVVKTSFLPQSKFVVTSSFTEIFEPHGEWEGCRTVTSVEVGTVSAVITITGKGNELIERRIIEEKPLILHGMKEDQEDAGCKKKHEDYVATSSSDWFINENFGDVFGRPSSSLGIAVGAALPAVEFKTNSKGAYTASVDLNNLSGLKVSGVSSFYYVGADDSDGLPRLKETESPRLYFAPLPQ